MPSGLSETQGTSHKIRVLLFLFELVVTLDKPAFVSLKTESVPLRGTTLYSFEKESYEQFT